MDRLELNQCSVLCGSKHVDTWTLEKVLGLQGVSKHWNFLALQYSLSSYHTVIIIKGEGGIWYLSKQHLACLLEFILC